MSVRRILNGMKLRHRALSNHNRHHPQKILLKTKDTQIKKTTINDVHQSCTLEHHFTSPCLVNDKQNIDTVYYHSLHTNIYMKEITSFFILK